tara:strand:+ start:301 stop:1476 length:1176 start_codon:yes stop_codon:yes gene_type:complete
MLLKILNKITLKLLKKNVKIINNNPNYKRKILIYYKTDSLFFNFFQNKYTHTNNAEIIYMIEILTSLGFSITLIDRSAKKTEIKKTLSQQYDLFLVNGAGNSAPNLSFIESNIKTKLKILYATGPEPKVNNHLISLAYKRFYERNKSKLITRRLVKDKNLKNDFSSYDALFYMGNKFNYDSFSKYKNLLKFNIFPSTMPSLALDLSLLNLKDPKNFLYFGGNGLIAKGLDLLLESFDGFSQYSLDICCPNEKDFWDFYKPIMKRNPNIKYHGFVDIQSKLFKKLTDKCTYIIFPGASEASATSVVTCMRRGLIPVCTKETGLDIDDFGFYLESNEIAFIRNLIDNLGKKKNYEIRQKIIKTFIASEKFTKSNFKRSFQEAILKTLIHKKLF